MSEEKAREFWITDDGVPTFESRVSNRPIAANSIHAIEYSAYNKLRIERDDLKKCEFAWEQQRREIEFLKSNSVYTIIKENAELRESLKLAVEALKDISTSALWREDEPWINVKSRVDKTLDKIKSKIGEKVF